MKRYYSYLIDHHTDASSTTVTFRPLIISICSKCGDNASFGIKKAKLSGDRVFYELICIECDFEIDYIDNKEYVDTFIFRNNTQYNKYDPRIMVILGEGVTEDLIDIVYEDKDKFFEAIKERTIPYNFV